MSKTENAIFIIGAVLLVGGAVCALLRWAGAPYIYAAGALCYASMQMLQRYEGRNFTVRRLRRIMLFSDVLLLCSAVLMYAGTDNPLGLDWITYVDYVRNRWVVLLLLAAILQLYTVIRIGQELEKEAKKR